MKTAKFVRGAAGVKLIVEENGAKIEYDCAEAEIAERLTIDEQGVFSVNGVYTHCYTVAIRVNLLPNASPRNLNV